jgi:predicted ATPase
MRLDVEHWCIPEVLRIRGEVALLPGGDGPAAAEELFSSAIHRAQRQKALSWEIRAAASLAQLWIGQHRGREARALLAALHERLPEDFVGADLRQTHRLMAELEQQRA